MSISYSVILNLAVALGVGLLIGLERERNKGEGPLRAPAGVRTFALTCLAGGISVVLGGPILLAVTTGGVLLLGALAYRRGAESDPGLTTEAALTVAVLLGGLAIQAPALAAGLGAVVTVLLAARSPLHHFIKSSLTGYEIRDLLIFAVATLVILPLLPSRQMGPYEALNPRAIWTIVVLIMAVGGAGHIAMRLVGVRFGLSFSGFITGFVSSTAAIGAMGAQARTTPDILKPAVAGAVLSTVATFAYLVVVIGVTDIAVLRAMAFPLLYGGMTAAVYGAIFTLQMGAEPASTTAQRSRAFSLPVAIGLATTLSAILVITAAAQSHFSDTGAILAAALAGFVDTHAAAISVASLVATGKMNAADAVVPILAGIATNTISKMAFAVAAGGWTFAVRVIPGLLLVLGAAWLGTLTFGN